MEKIGVIKRIRRYPVKSMMGEDLREAFVSLTGIPGDRTLCIYRRQNRRQKVSLDDRTPSHEMILFKPSFSTSSAIEVETPEGEKYDINAKEFKEFLEKRFGRELTLKHRKEGLHDSRPISLFGQQTHGRLSKEVDMQLQQERFRANFYVDWKNGGPFFEDELVGEMMELGKEARIMIDKKDSRCIIPVIDPSTAIPSPNVLKNTKDNHGGCAGVYATAAQQETVKVNDSIILL